MSEVSGVMVVNNGKCLVCKRSKDTNYPNTWSLPMGHSEKGEAPIETAKREFKEEMGVDIVGDLEMIGKLDYVTVFKIVKGKKIVPDLKNAKDGFEHSQCIYASKEIIRNLNMENSLQNLLLNFL